jgi:hypothetical protein
MSKLAPVLIIVALVIFIVPLILIWSMNTLFPALAIPYTLETWAATIILSSIFKTTVSKK